jgi:exfoliative toxin A/B
MRISKLFRRASIPCAGVALGFAALGNLLQSYAEAFHILCGLISLFFVVLLIGKLLVDSKSLRKAMGNPIQASVAGTLSMAIMLLSTYIAAQAHVMAFVIWIAAICAHITLIVWFTRQYFLKSFKLERVFASYFIVYVGIVVASVTAPAFGMQSFGNVAFWFGLACFAALLFPVTKRYVQVKETPQAALPIFCIYAAPASLCVAGYVQSGQPRSLLLAYVLLAIASCIYVVVLLRLPRLLRLPFYPSYASFTFPFVISAIATKQVGALLAKAGMSIAWLGVVATVETALAAALCLYVALRFCGALFVGLSDEREERLAD